MGSRSITRILPRGWTGAGYRSGGPKAAYTYMGYTLPTQFADGSGITPVDNQTITGTRFQGSFCAASGVTFNGCLIRGASPNDRLTGNQGSNITYKNCTWEGIGSGFTNKYQFAINDFAFGMSPGLKVLSSDMSDGGNFIFTHGNYATSGRQLYQDLYIWGACLDNDPATGNPYHTDGIGALDTPDTANGIDMDHVVFATYGNTNGIAFQNGTFTSINATNCVGTGFGYFVVFAGTGGTATDIGFTDNEYWTLLAPQQGSAGAGGGPLYSNVAGDSTWYNDAHGSTWRRNKWITQLDSGRAAQFPWAGAFDWGHTANNGKFWMPVSTDATSNGFDDTPFVSAIDYDGS